MQENQLQQIIKNTKLERNEKIQSLIKAYAAVESPHLKKQIETFIAKKTADAKLNPYPEKLQLKHTDKDSIKLGETKERQTIQTSIDNLSQQQLIVGQVFSGFDSGDGYGGSNSSERSRTDLNDFQ